MSNTNRFLLGSVALVIWACGFIAPYWFPTVGYAAKSSGEVRTLAEIVGTGIPSSNTALYKVPAGHRLILTDVNFQSCGLVNIYRNDTVVSRSNTPNEPMRSYQSGIAFGEGSTVGIADLSSCGGQEFYELRGYLEPQ